MAEKLTSWSRTASQRFVSATPTCTASPAARSSPPPTSSTWLEDGAAYCEAIMTVDLSHNVVAGFEHGFQDILARPDAATLRRVPWDPERGLCIADLERMDGEPYGVDSRGVLKRAIDGVRRAGSSRSSARSSSSTCARPTRLAQRLPPLRRQRQPRLHGRRRRRPARPAAEMLHACADLQPGAYAANHEFGRAQYEINLRHSDALDATDRAYLFKNRSRRCRPGWPAGHVHRQALERRRGLGLPPAPVAVRRFRRQPAERRRRRAAVADRAPLPGRAARARAGADGVLHPTTNAYRRIHEEALVPTLVSWGPTTGCAWRGCRASAAALPASSCGWATAPPTPTWPPPPPCSPGWMGSSGSWSRRRRSKG